MALSGGGFRAVAFHLGALRALHDRGVLDRVEVISAVSGGAVIAAIWAYTDGDFTAFDRRVTQLLRTGLTADVARTLLLSRRAPQAAAAALRAAAGTIASHVATAANRLTPWETSRANPDAATIQPDSDAYHCTARRS
jgi:NTE family protein